jgi:hypothetical protein
MIKQDIQRIIWQQPVSNCRHSNPPITLKRHSNCIEVGQSIDGNFGVVEVDYRSVPEVIEAMQALLDEYRFDCGV